MCAMPMVQSPRDHGADGCVDIAHRAGIAEHVSMCRHCACACVLRCGAVDAPSTSFLVRRVINQPPSDHSSCDQHFASWPTSHCGQHLSLCKALAFSSLILSLARALALSLSLALALSLSLSRVYLQKKRRQKKKSCDRRVTERDPSCSRGMRCHVHLMCPPSRNVLEHSRNEREQRGRGAVGVSGGGGEQTEERRAKTG